METDSQPMDSFEDNLKRKTSRGLAHILQGNNNSNGFGNSLGSLKFDVPNGINRNQDLSNTSFLNQNSAPLENRGMNNIFGQPLQFQRENIPANNNSSRVGDMSMNTFPNRILIDTNNRNITNDNNTRNMNMNMSMNMNNHSNDDNGYQSKRHRSMETDDDEYPDDSPKDDNAYVSVRSRNADNETININSPEMRNREFESIVASLRAENDVVTNKKDQDISNLRKVCKRLMDTNSYLESELKRCGEENKILKRAVQVLDQKNKDSNNYILARDNAISQMSQRIHDLERANAILLQKLTEDNANNMYQGSSYNFPKPPPDVF